MRVAVRNGKFLDKQSFLCYSLEEIVNRNKCLLYFSLGAKYEEWPTYY